MTREIPANEEIGKFFEEAANHILHTCVLECDARLKLATPVDTGTMRNAWAIGKNKDAAFKLEEGKGGPKEPKARLVADATTQAVDIGLRNPQRREYSEKERIGNTYVITNNMEYAEPIAFGTGLPPSWGGSHRSKQCEPGYPEKIAKSMEKWVEREFDRMIRSGRF